MELELKQDIVTCCEVIAEYTGCQEETLEVIVPDACPDILRIIDVCAQVLLTGKQAEDGRVTLNGTIAAVVLYQPEGEPGIRRVEVQIPFTFKQDLPDVKSTNTIHASVKLQSADARILNPRKMLVRADLIAQLTAYQETKYMISTQAEDPEGCDLCQKQNKIEFVHLIATPERTFSVSDEVRFQHNGAIPALMFCRAHPHSVEERLIGTKLIFKGNIDLELLLCDAQGVLSLRRESIPFSQILEVPETESTDSCQIGIEVMSFTCTPDLEEEGRIRLEMELLAQAQVRCRRQAAVLSDIYSTTHEMETQTEKFAFCPAYQLSITPQSVRALLETDELVRSIGDTQVLFGPITQKRTGTLLTLACVCKIRVLYFDEQQQLRALKKDAPIQVELDCDEDYSCCSCKILPGEVLTLPAAGGIEFRLSADFSCMLQRHDSTDMISSAQIGVLRCTDGPRPSVVLRMAGAEESLWDIAKIYGTTTRRILQANELEETGSYHGRMLLIPSGR